MKKYGIAMLTAVLATALSIPISVIGQADSSGAPDKPLIDKASLVKGKTAIEAAKAAKSLIASTAKEAGTKEEIRMKVTELIAVLYAAVLKGDPDTREAVVTALVEGTPAEYQSTVIAIIAALSDANLSEGDALATQKKAIAAAKDAKTAKAAAASPDSVLGVALGKRVKELAKNTNEAIAEFPEDATGSTRVTSSTTTTTTTTTTTSTTRPSPTPVGLR